jgi:hypothetical protein
MKASAAKRRDPISLGDTVRNEQQKSVLLCERSRLSCQQSAKQMQRASDNMAAASEHIARDGKKNEGRLHS